VTARPIEDIARKAMARAEAMPEPHRADDMEVLVFARECRADMPLLAAEVLRLSEENRRQAEEVAWLRKAAATGRAALDRIVLHSIVLEYSAERGGFSRCQHCGGRSNAVGHVEHVDDTCPCAIAEQALTEHAGSVREDVGALADEVLRLRVAVRALAREVDEDAARSKAGERDACQRERPTAQPAYYCGEANAHRTDADRLWTLVGGRPTP
jgi:cell division septum initiation protein DivIVA